MRIGERRFEWGTRTFVMGVLNVTPDSFSGDGVAHDAEGLDAKVAEMVDAVPDIIDVGGESTRPGSDQISADEEIARIMPAFEALHGAGWEFPISIDTRKSAVARVALAQGVTLVNDVSGGTYDPEILDVTAAGGAAFVVTHNRRGEVRQSGIGSHQSHVAYDDLIQDVWQDGQRLLGTARRAGIPSDRLLFDPGFGFGKSPDQNVELLRDMGALRSIGVPILVGVSRKSFVGYVLDLPAGDRVEGSLAAAVIAVGNGADVVRTHDVTATRRAVAVADAIYRPGC